MFSLEVEKRKNWKDEDELTVRFSDCVMGGFYFSTYLPTGIAIRLRDKLIALLPQENSAEGEDSSLDVTPIVRNPLALNEDALAEVFNPTIHCVESVTQADGLGDGDVLPDGQTVGNLLAQ